MTTLRHTEAQQLLGAHSLNALDRDEAVAVDLHVADCPRCRSELQSYVETAALLAFEGEEAPPGLWEKIQLSLVEPPPKLELARVTDIRRSAWQAKGLQVMAVAAAVLSLLALGVAIENRRSDPAPTNLAATLAEVAVHPETRRVSLVAPDGTRRAQVFILRGQGWMADDDLPALGDDQTYQLWGQRGATTVSLGVLGSDPDVASFAADDGFHAMAITAEKKPGVVSPGGPPVASGLIQSQ